MDNLFSMREEEEGEGEKHRFFLFLGVGESGIGFCQREHKIFFVGTKTNFQNTVEYEPSKKHKNVVNLFSLRTVSPSFHTP